jgi:hypothetical protein
MENAAYFVIHERMQTWIDSQRQIRRTRLLDFLKYFHIKSFNWRTKYLIIEDMLELGLLKKINKNIYEWVPHKKTKILNDDRYINSFLIRKEKEK